MGGSRVRSKENAKQERGEKKNPLRGLVRKNRVQKPSSLTLTTKEFVELSGGLGQVVLMSSLLA